MRNVDKLIKIFCDPEFLAQYWQKKPKVWKALKKYFLTTAKLDSYVKLVDRHQKYFPDSLSFYRGGRQIDFENIANNLELKTSDWVDLIKQHPVLVQRLYFSNEFFAQMSLLVQYYFSAFTPICGYFSHGGTKGARKHRDRGHIIVFQFEGSCRWILHDKSRRKKIMDVVMKPGMVMYVPQGVYHRVERLSDFNVHVSMGLRYRHPREEMEIMLNSSVFRPALLDRHRDLSTEEQNLLLQNYSDNPLERDN